MRKSSLVAVIFAISALLSLAGSATAQDRKSGVKVGPAVKTVEPAVTTKGHKAAIAVVMREGKLQFVAKKDRILRHVQKAFAESRDGGSVKDIELLSYERGNYLAARMEKGGTAFLKLEPVGGGPQGIFVIGWDSVTCAASNCPCNLSWGGGSPQCNCGGPGEIPGASASCSLVTAKKYELATSLLNAALLSDGFEEATDTGTTVEGPNKQIWTVTKAMTPIRKGN